MNTLRLREIPVVGLLATIVTCMTPGAQAQQVPASKDWTVSGCLDWYYQYDFDRPPVGSAVVGRQFNVKHDQFGFALAEVNIVRAPTAKNPVGLTVTGTLGKNADLAHATEPGGANTYKYLQQAYVTYLTGGKTPVTIDFGKFASWCGYEVFESAANDNYGRSFLYTLGQPLYHAGLRLSAPIGGRLTGSFYIVNGWNEVEDANGGKTLGATLTANPGRPFTVTLNWMGGQEGSDTANVVGSFGGIGFPSAGIRDVNVLDLIAVWQATTRLKLALNADYTDASRPGLAGGHWSGQALYARHQCTETVAVAVRAEHFEDTNGLRTGAATSLNSVVGTLECVVAKSLVNRLELRYDHSTAPLFAGNSGAAKKDQTTLVFSQVLKF